MSTGQGVISTNDLMKKLVMSKKVMDKVEVGDYHKGNINEDILRSNPEDLVMSESLQPQPQSVKPTATPDVDRIKSSKLPDAIKKAMIENPIPQISLNDSIDMNFVKGAKRLMEQEGIQPKKQYKPSPAPTTRTSVPIGTTTGIDMNTISVMIENTIRKVLDEKLNQILTAQQTSTINENLVLKVGDSIFKGKITAVNKSK